MGAPNAAPPSPERIFNTANAFQQSAALKAAIELGVFTLIAEGKRTARDIAEGCAASTKGVRVLCDYMTVQGFLTKTGDSYELAPDSAAFLNRHSPAYMGSVADFLLSPHLMEGFNDIAGCVRKGGTLMEGHGTVEAENPIWQTFARAMAPMMRMPAQAIAGVVDLPSDRPVKVLDIAAGHGVFGIALAEKRPNVEVTAVDWRGVLEVAKENAQAAGVSDRYRTLPGDAFQVEFGGGYDVALITNFLHHFDPPTNEALLRKVHAALNEGGRGVTLEFVPNEDRVSPPIPATFSLIMLAGTPSGDAYTERELEAMARNAGFARSECRELPFSPQKIMISYK